MSHVIIGTGPAGVIAAETLRAQRPADDIVLVGDEPEPPYSRMAIPYLLERQHRRGGHPPAQGRRTTFPQLRITLRQAAAQSVDTQARTVALERRRHAGL